MKTYFTHISSFQLAKIVPLLLIIVMYSSCKKCYTCNYNIYSNSVGGTGTDGSKEFCGTEKQMKKFESDNNSTYQVTSPSGTIEYKKSTYCFRN